MFGNKLTEEKIPSEVTKEIKEFLGDNFVFDLRQDYDINEHCKTYKAKFSEQNSDVVLRKVFDMAESDFVEKAVKEVINYSIRVDHSNKDRPVVFNVESFVSHTEV